MGGASARLPFGSAFLSITAHDGTGVPLVDVARKCPRCGRVSRVSGVPAEGFYAWYHGQHAQRALPGLSDGQRETLMTGYHEECFGLDVPDDDDGEPAEPEP